MARARQRVLMGRTDRDCVGPRLWNLVVKKAKTVCMV